MQGLGLYKLAMNIAATFLRQVGTGLLQLITIAIIARFFGPEGSGVYILAILFPVTLATLLNLGLGPANVYFLGARKVKPSIAWRKTLELSGLIILSGWIIGSIIIFFYAESWFNNVPSVVLWLSLLVFPVVFINAAVGNFFQGLQKFKEYNVLLLLAPILNIIFVAGLFVCDRAEVVAIYLAYFISVIISSIFGLITLNRAMENIAGPCGKSYKKDVLVYGYKAHLSNILAFINNRADIFLLSYFIGPVAVGIYAIAVNITEKLWLISGAVSTVILPRLSQLSNDELKRNTLTPLIARSVLWLTALVGLLLGSVGYYLIVFIFGLAFQPAYLVVVILIPGVILGSCSMVLANDMAARGRPELNLATSWITVVINIAGNVWLIPDHGINGAALATSFAYCINFVMRLAMHSYFTGIPFYKNIVLSQADFNYLIAFIKNR